MPVRKFRSVEEMNQPIWRQAGDSQLYRAIAGVWEVARRTNPRRFQPGIHKYRSIDEMSLAREDAIAEYVAQLHRQRHGQ